MARPRRARLATSTLPCKFGAHMSIAGGYERAVVAAHDVGFQAVQVFTKNSNQWNAPALTFEQAGAFRQALERTGIRDTVAHSSYLINLASPDDALWNRSIEAMVVEMQRCHKLGIGDLVVHPGAHRGTGEETGLRRIALAIDELHRRTQDLGVTIDLETTAGQGSSLGYRFDHLQSILELVTHPRRLGVCVDTCHIFAAGYSLDRPERYDETIKQLDGTIGIDRLRVWHLNDSSRECGSRVDRHAGIGAGKIGLEPFRRLVNDLRFRHLPMILETPKGIEDGEDLDARNLRILKQLVVT
ncbi:MAG: deoxyribonuclease IV [Isosphaeraceae bacterium]